MAPAILRYASTLALVAVSLSVRYVFRDLFELKVPYLQFYPVIMLAAWFGGLGPGLLATISSALAAVYFLLPPTGIAVDDTADQVSLGVFVATGLAIAWLNEQLHRARDQQRAAAESATSRAERLDAILNTTVDGIIVIDARGAIEAFNHGAEQLFGYPATEVIGRNVNLLMPSPHHELHDSYLEHYLATGDAKIIGIGREVLGRRRDGSAFPVHLSVGEMTIGGARKFTGMLHDLSKRARLGEQLEASDARWRAVVDAAVDGIIVIDAHGRIESLNPGAERLFGHQESEVLGRNVAMLMPSPFHEEHDTYLARYLSTGRAKIIGLGREVRGLRKDGSTFPLHLSVGEMTIQGERKFTGILHDLSDRVRVETQLREQTALATLGEMAAVIAHEVKNPLAGIRGAIQVVGKRLPTDHTAGPVLTEIVQRIDSLDRMMKDLLLFARPPQPRRQLTEVGPLVSTTARLLSQDPALSGFQIQVRGTSPAISVDAEMLKVVFHNLLINAAHAMEGRGSMCVDVRTYDSTCELAFIDQGPGIPPDILEKIFVPFFTTKARGSGLGLPTAKRLVEAHGGDIVISSPPTGGTTVLVRLPIGA